MRLSHSLPCRLARLTFTLLMTLTWCGLARTASAAAPASGGRQAGDDPARVRHVAESLERTIKFYEKAQPTIPRDTFDPDALTRQVGSDPTKLFEWVRDNTAPAPYRGALRGAVGVLMDRSGSSLDRALLLSRLLRLAGHDARLARGTLAPDRAGALLKQVWEDPAAAPPVPPAAALDRATIAHFASQTGLDPAELAQSVEKLELDSQRRSEDLAATVAEQTEALSRLLGDPAPAAAADARAGHLAAVADHWWVQSLQDGKWVDLDPATPESKPGESLTAAVETIELTATGALPPAAVALAHEVELRIAVERTDGGASKTEVAFRHALRPAETAGAVGRLQITPMDWPTDLDLTSDPQTTMRTALLAQQRWLPVLVLDGNTIIQGSFDAHGVVDPNPVLDPMKKTGGSAAKGASDAFDVLNDAPPPAAQQPSGELTAVWLECEIRVPGEKPRVVRRDLFDAIGPASRAAGTPPRAEPDEAMRLRRSASLYRQVDVLAVGFVPSMDYVQHLGMANLLANGPVLLKSLREWEAKPLKQSIRDLSAIKPLPSAVLGWATGRKAPFGAGAGLVIDRPNVFAVHDGFGIDAAGRLVGRKQTDILANDVAVRGAAGPEAFKARLSQGVLETALEREVLRRPAPGVNAAALFESAGTGRATWVKLASPDDPQLAALALGADTLARIRGDLRAGYTVVAPTAPVTVGQQSREGWWRIDPRDGTCIGFAADGFGSELAEFAIVLTSILIEAGMAFHCLDEGHGYGCIICFVIFAVLDVASFGQFSVGCSLVVAGANLGGSAACEAIAGALGD